MSAHPSLSVLVPAYTARPAPFTKREAVRVIVRGHNDAHNARGKGSKAARRARQMSRVHSLPLGLPKWM